MILCHVAVSVNRGSCFCGVLAIGALLVEAYIRALAVWKLPNLNPLFLQPKGRVGSSCSLFPTCNTRSRICSGNVREESPPEPLVLHVVLQTERLKPFYADSYDASVASGI